MRREPVDRNAASPSGALRLASSRRTLPLGETDPAGQERRRDRQGRSRAGEVRRGHGDKTPAGGHGGDGKPKREDTVRRRSQGIDPRTLEHDEEPEQQRGQLVTQERDPDEHQRRVRLPQRHEGRPDGCGEQQSDDAGGQTQTECVADAARDLVGRIACDVAQDDRVDPAADDQDEWKERERERVVAEGPGAEIARDEDDEPERRQLLDDLRQEDPTRRAGGRGHSAALLGRGYLGSFCARTT